MFYADQTEWKISKSNSLRLMEVIYILFFTGRYRLFGWIQQQETRRRLLLLLFHKM